MDAITPIEKKAIIPTEDNGCNITHREKIMQ
jgi:hypothetical protein